MTQEELEKFYTEQRAAWMLRSPIPTSEDLHLARTLDAQLNPHGEHHKPKRRSETEIHADLAMTYADVALTRIYGPSYKEYLNQINGARPYGQR